MIEISESETRERLMSASPTFHEPAIGVRNLGDTVYATWFKLYPPIKPRRDDTAMLIGYARVSTTDQKMDLQIDALRKAGCEDDFIYQEHASGKRARIETR